MIYISVNNNQLGIHFGNFECHKVADAKGLKGLDNQRNQLVASNECAVEDRSVS